jgi:hypothetical protein
MGQKIDNYDKADIMGKITIVAGDLTKANVEAIVNAATDAFF